MTTAANCPESLVLAGEFEELSKHFDAIQMSPEPFSAIRRETDLILPVGAGTLLYQALDAGLLGDSKSDEWDLRKAREQRAKETIQALDGKILRLLRAKKSEVWKGKLPCYMSLDDIKVSRARELNDLREEFRRDLRSPVTAEDRRRSQLTTEGSWFAYLWFELIPQCPDGFRADWADVLPTVDMFTPFASKLSAEPHIGPTGWGLAGQTQDERILYRVKASAEIQGMACRRVAKTLREQSRMDELRHAKRKPASENGPFGPPTSKTPKRRPGINARMIEVIQKNVAALGWKSGQWAKHLKCARSTVVATVTWKDSAMGRERERAERALDRRTNRKR